MRLKKGIPSVPWFPIVQKKLSKASKNAELNRKGLEKEKKGGDLLEVFTEPAVRKPEQPPARVEEPAPVRPAPEPLLEVRTSFSGAEPAAHNNIFSLNWANRVPVVVKRPVAEISVLRI